MAQKETMFLELPGADLKEFKLGDKVTATVSGKLIELEAPRKIEFPDGDTETMPAAVGIEIIGKATLVPKSNKKDDFADLSEEKEGD